MGTTDHDEDVVRELFRKEFTGFDNFEECWSAKKDSVFEGLDRGFVEYWWRALKVADLAVPEGYAFVRRHGKRAI